MKYILASSNKGKLKEIQELMSELDITVYSEIIDEFEIEETGKTFQQNALLKARAVYEKLPDKNCIVLSDDSGITVPILGGRPGIFSARFAGVGASDAQNRAKMIEELQTLGLQRTPAFYTAAIAAVTSQGEYTTHGYCYGDVISQERGESGFGYDFLFIPTGYDKTLGELGATVKKEVSHRVKGIQLMQKILQ